MFGSDNAYKEKKPMSEWWEWLLGTPTGYDKGSGINWGGLSGGGIFDDSIDWKKAASGAKSGAKIGGNIYPLWGHLIGGVAGGAAGAGFSGSEDENDGLAAAFEGRAKNNDGFNYGDYNWLQYVNQAADMYGGGGGGYNKWIDLWDTNPASSTTRNTPYTGGFSLDGAGNLMNVNADQMSGSFKGGFGSQGSPQTQQPNPYQRAAMIEGYGNRNKGYQII